MYNKSHGKEINAVFTVGIDLGTTVSVVSYIDGDGAPVAVPIGGGITTPSVVNYSGKAAIVGREAVYKMDADSTVFSAKRSMGTESKFCGRNSIEISADILSYLKKNAEENIGKKIDAAVITVPAHFSDSQRSATRHAASMAGIRVLRLINEPTAAAIAFGLDKKKDGVFAVYDFGGGTFDFSVLRLMNGVFQVLATGGDNYLGGDDIDDAILDYNARLHGLNFAMENERIPGKLVAKFLKEQLKDLREVSKDYVYKNKNYEFKLTEDILRSVSCDFVQKSLKIADQVLQDARLDAAKLNGVVMVGGMTKLKLIKEEVQKHFQVKIFDDINPEEAVAFGAAIYADSIVRKNMLLIDVVPLTLGVETLGGGVDKIIHRSTPIPTVEKREYTTYQNNQTGIKFHIVQGERPIADECRSLANFELIEIPPMQAGMARVVVEFSVDINGLLSVKAHERETGIQQTVVVDPSSGLSSDEIASMLRKAEANRKEDSIHTRNITVKIESERMIKFWRTIIAEIPLDSQKIANDELECLENALKAELYQDVIVHKQKLESIFGPFLDEIINSRLGGKIVAELT
ncbi:MAG: Hsp70 family protein [Holosporaceae bacterium]|jgi:molecular chaperone HscA|nr:Hsp70 family protein [Holosporaceae bacterium]